MGKPEKCSKPRQTITFKMSCLSFLVSANDSFYAISVLFNVTLNYCLCSKIIPEKNATQKIETRKLLTYWPFYFHLFERLQKTIRIIQKDKFVP
jgi:hypothetical protein